VWRERRPGWERILFRNTCSCFKCSDTNSRKPKKTEVVIQQPCTPSHLHGRRHARRIALLAWA
jgi:hypothetical protein